MKAQLRKERETRDLERLKVGVGIQLILQPSSLENCLHMDRPPSFFRDLPPIRMLRQFGCHIGNLINIVNVGDVSDVSDVSLLFYSDVHIPNISKKLNISNICNI
jgi:hypothetical protein